MNLVFLLEERSMEVFLRGLLPRILPARVGFTLVPHEGKSDLERSLPRKLRAWRTPDTRFVVVRDQDSDDCVRIKDRLVAICARAGRSDTLVRVACRELEAWFIGDLAAVGRAFALPALASQQNKARYRSPDRLGSPSRELGRLVLGYGKVGGARRMGPLIDVDNRRSRSFSVFVEGVRRISGAS